MLTIIRKPSAWLIAAFTILSLFLWHGNRQKQEALKVYKQQYQAKVDDAFVTLFNKTPSYLPLADAFETIGQAPDTAKPDVVQQSIDAAKRLGEELTDQTVDLIRFSGIFDNNTAEASVEDFIGSDAQQQDALFLLAIRCDIHRIAYNISALYWKARPKVIPKDTKTMLLALAKEIRAMDDAMTRLMPAAERAAHGAASVTELKKQFRAELEPRLNKIEAIQRSANFP
ncbi:hypothetical protein ACFFSY_10365 [Paenibacillus aurantiacus]|uniref:Uncharacterized protein n=1 Tax=Paenibacillus aurantiacus TaxID=1936118 RepID=A0ABV5KQB6_9BACL